MTIQDWDKLWRQDKEQYKKEYCKFMGDESNIGQCQECPELVGHFVGFETMPCGQQNCWVACHCE